MHSPNITQENIFRIRDLFPGCVTEIKGQDGRLKLAVDFDQLRQELSESIVEGPQERYHLNWPGKREALLTANATVEKTLRPYRGESASFDETKNLFIEGDNLEVLKLLQEAYLGKVGVIYIDPPYNTGSDFIYRDNFTSEAASYKRQSNQVDDSGNRLVANADTNGRFHSDWLSMIYMRIRLARNLLRDNGVIFISIDDHEVSNLKAVCDEVFGSRQLIGIFKWNRTSKAPTLSPKIRGKFEYVLCYEKADVFRLRGPESYNEAAPLFNSGNPPTRIRFEAQNVHFHFADGLYKQGEYGKGDKVVILHDDITVKDGKNQDPFEMTARFKWSQKTVNARISEGQQLFFKTAKFATMYYSLETGGDKFIAPSDLLSQDECGVLRNDEGYSEIKALFDDVAVFDYVKPVSLIEYLVRMVDDKESIVLDFFAGSGTTADAVLKLNAKDGGHRRFILVQLPEPCSAASPAAQIGLSNIADLCKERIRRAGERHLANECHPDWNKDVGFRTLKVDTSNMADVYYRPDALEKNSLDLIVENIKHGRTSEDLLFQVMLDWGIDLALPIAKQAIQGRDVFLVDGNALAACFDSHCGVDEDFVKELAKVQPLRAVFRDAGFKDSSVKINVEQIFKLLSPATEVKCI
ncbi:MAG: site-specific DNA-methyltransferase [Burkholderiales bacterium]|nr:site-specific DNA-methyltransferase [Burkholderiales bacterium]